MTVFTSPSFDNHELVSFASDPASGLRAIIAVHNTNLGAAVGGCRFFDYASDDEALEDVLRLSRGMTYKSALAGLPMGGGKSVIIGNPKTQKTPALLHAMGRFLNSLGGKYITAEDSGTGVADMRTIGEVTPYISGVGNMDRFGGDPSPYTAYGVYCGILAAVKHKTGRDSVADLTVAVQGAGAVGRFLIQRLIEDGAKVLMADISEENLKAATAMGAAAVSPEDILSVPADVLSPCAMGAVINDRTLGLINAGIIAGGANNQLAEVRHGEMLQQRGILYAPDFVINAGGIIAIHHQQTGSDEARATAHVEEIGGTLSRIFQRAEAEQATTGAVAERMAEAIFGSAVKPDAVKTAQC